MSTVTDDRLDRLTQEIRELDRNMDRRFAEVPTRSSLYYRLTSSDIILYAILFVVVLTAAGLANTH
jgi:hypothetical protein